MKRRERTGSLDGETAPAKRVATSAAAAAASSSAREYDVWSAGGDESGEETPEQGGGGRGIAELNVRGESAPPLPAGRVFSIQVGTEMFKLSGASISSDAPSYFSTTFSAQLAAAPGADTQTLYLDRDPATFHDISQHLQGYHVAPRDSGHFVRLFADAQFYSLPRLMQQLWKSDIYIAVGGHEFRLPRDVFGTQAQGNEPNFFSLGFGHFLGTPSEVFPGLDRRALLRPPSIAPPAVRGRDADVFRELVRLLMGYDVAVRDETHRAALLRDARYFHFRGLEQRLLPCERAFNPRRQQPDMLLRLEDIRQSGVSFVADSALSASSSTYPLPGEAYYARPYVDTAPAALLLALPPSSAVLDPRAMRARLLPPAKGKFAALCAVLASKVNLPATAMPALGLMMREGGVGGGGGSSRGGGNGEDNAPRSALAPDEHLGIRVEVGEEAWLDVDGAGAWCVTDASASAPLRPRLRFEGGVAPATFVQRDNEAARGTGEGEKEECWAIARSQWRVRVMPDTGVGGRPEVVLSAVRVEVVTCERARNRGRGFLGMG